MSEKGTKSKTDEETSIVERFITGGHHYKTTIEDGQRHVEGRGRTREEAEKVASKKWEKSKD